MRAFIYAAGRALRLGPASRKQPKILIEIGNKTLLEWNAQRLAEVGIRRATVVTGYKRELVSAAFAELKKTYGVEFTETFNRDFAEGSVLSFHASLPELLTQTGPVLLMDGDVLYPAEMLRRLIHSPHPTALLIDRHYSMEDDDPVLVPLREGRPFDFIKCWKGKADHVGESIGFFKVDSGDLRLLAEETQLRTEGERRQESYDAVLRALVVAGRFHAEDVTDVPWTEIDFPKDLELARKQILPAVLAFEKNSLLLRR